MKKWIFNLPVKAVALLLAVVSFFCAAVSGAGIFVLLDTDGYRRDGDELTERYLGRQFSYLTYEIAEVCHDREYELLSYLSDIRREVKCEVEILSSAGTVYSDRSDGDYTVSIIDEIGYTQSDPYQIETWYRVSVYLMEPAEGSETELRLQLLLFFHRIRYALIAICASCAAAFVLLLVFLCCLAGRKGDGETKFNFFHRVPFELYVAGGLFVLLMEINFLAELAELWFVLLCAFAFVIVDILCFLPVVMTFAVRCKRGALLSTTFVGICWEWLKKLFAVLLRLWQDARLVPKIVIVMSGIAVFDLFLAATLGFHGSMVFFLMEGVCLAAILVWYGASLQRLEHTAREIASGNLSARCDLTLLPPGLRSFGEKMNSGAEGMEKAVEEKIKSERFKTELITNVSHDIKTPLTSIVNFVDLMKKEEIENEKVLSYLEVLDRQSARLKKLTEDLVESSKAASGVLPVELAPCDAGVLLEQAVGEYQALLEEKGLTPCLSVPAEPCYIMADGKKLWRVMDNLLQNIVKYALPGTRVYASLEAREEKVDLVFRNISENPISLSGEHLTERFVRGDLSRTGEGSGLGLSIAQSLAELQKGTLTLTVDGDLFKAVVTFDRMMTE